MAQSVNTFTELNTDSHPLNTKPTVMTDALNATLTTKGENQLILQNMHGNDLISMLTPDYKPLGLAVFNDIAYIVSGKFDTDGNFLSGEIGTFPSPDWSNLFGQPDIDPEYFLPLVNIYQPLYNFSNSTIDSELDNDLFYTEPFRTSLLNFAPGHLIEVEIQPSYDGSVNIILADEKNPMRLINSRFRLDDSGKRAAVADRRQLKDTNTYSNTRFGSVRLIRQPNKIVDLEFEGVESGGVWEAGTYHFYFRYIDSDGSLTDVIEQSMPVAISNNATYGSITGEITDKLVKFKLSNLDKTFSGVKVYYTIAQGSETEAVTAYEIVSLYDIIDDSIDITLFGSEVTKPLNIDTLNVEYSSINSVKTITQYNDQLLIGNISSATQNYEKFREIALDLKIVEKEKPLYIRAKGNGYADPDNVYYNLGYWAGETYEIGIVFVLTKGRGLTPAFPIRGGDNYDNNFSYTANTNFENSGYVDTNNNTVTSTENRLGVYRTNKCRKKLLFNQGDPLPPTPVPLKNYADSTMVKYFGVDISSLKTNTFVQKETDGFFFVRKKRVKDCLMQGFITTANQSVILKDGLTLTNGIKQNTFAYYGAPAGYLEFKDAIDNTHIRRLGGTFNNSPQHFGFYATDLLADPKSGASLFDGSRKGIMYNNAPVVAYEDLATGNVNSVITAVSIFYDGLPDIGLGTTTNGLNIRVNNGGQIGPYYWSDLGGGVVTTTIPFYFEEILGGVVTTNIVLTSAVITLNISDPNNITGSFEFIGLPSPSSSFAVEPYNNFIAPAAVFDDPIFPFKRLEIDFSGLQFTDSNGVDHILSNDLFAEIRFTYTNITNSTSLNVIAALGAVELGNYDFCPTLLQPNINNIQREFDFKYIGGAIEPVVHKQWANIFRKGVWLDPSYFSGNLVFTKIADYVGISSNNTDVFEIFNLLRINQEYVSNNINNPNTQDFINFVQNIGFPIGVLANIYNDSNGAATIETWKSKYNNSNSDQLYFQITKRYRWTDTTLNNDIDLFNGDCFISYTYKRNAYGLGVAASPLATDPTLYGDEGFGITERGFVFPIITESNYNSALRTKENFSAIENSIYASFRKFWPLYSTKTELRLSRQPESMGTNFGYSKVLGNKYSIGLNDRSPSFGLQFSNRIMVSAAAVAGNFFNGYTNFSGLNFRDYNKQLGEITRLITHNDYVYCIFETGVGVVPINQRTMVSQETGGVFLDNAEVLAQKMQIISSEYGSDQQFSIIKTDNFVYGVDLSKNKIWRVSSNGGQHTLDIISDFAVQTILNQYKKRLLSNSLNNLVKTNYDRERNNVIFTYFSEQNGVFNTDYYEVIDNPEPEGPVCPTDLIIENNDPNIPPHYKSLSGKKITQECCITLPNSDWSAVSGEDQFYCLYTPVGGGPLDPDTDQVQRKVFTDTIVQPRLEDTTPVDTTTETEETLQQKLISQLLRKNTIGSLYWNETLSKWISRLSWNPIWTFNLSSNLYSFSGTKEYDKIWKHFSEDVPFCHFYGDQDKFMFEFIVVENSSTQKILDNLISICNRTFPNRITYSLLENDFDYELSDAFTGGVNNGYTELMKRRHEETHVSNLLNGTDNLWTATNIGPLPSGNAGFTMVATNGDPISQEEAERIVGGYVIYNGIVYIIGNVVAISGVFYNEILNQNGINILGAMPVGWTFDRIDFGIIRQNMEYIEDELYIEVGRDINKSHIRDKALRVRFLYEGYDYVTVQAVISKFIHSFG